jgi:hypothetical protein
VLPLGSIADDFATAVGVVAGMIAVGGFVGHAPWVLNRGADHEIQQATVIGGLLGGAVGAFVVVLSAIADMVLL